MTKSRYLSCESTVAHRRSYAAYSCYYCYYDRMTWITFRQVVLGTLFGLYLGINFIILTKRIDCLLSHLQKDESLDVFPVMDSSGISDGDNNFLFIGIMTVRQHLNTRVKAGNWTWVPHVRGKVVYFVGEGEPYTGKSVYYHL